jgi:SAM-dependent methyltransferase
VSGDGACRFCGNMLDTTVLDLGMSPLSNALISPAGAAFVEPMYPLRAQLCRSCTLVQLPQFASARELFEEYAYFSSYSTTWLEHARSFAERMVERLRLSRRSLVVELASNDGYLLQYFQARAVGVLGIEPARNVAQVAVSKGIPSIAEFFGTELAQRLATGGQKADLLIANNVLAHVPDLNDFVEGIVTLLKHDGTATIEFPHLLRTVERGEFDQFYHEHFSYFSLTAAEKVFVAHGLHVAAVEELATHGGSLRLYVRHGTSADEDGSIAAIKAAERAAGLERPEGYHPLAHAAQRTKGELRDFFARAKAEKKRIVGYGAPAKATTLLNYCGIGKDMLEFTVDRSAQKQGKLIPGVRIPIEPVERIAQVRPDYVLVLAWNIADEIVHQMSSIREWSGRFVVPIPALRVA